MDFEEECYDKKKDALAFDLTLYNFLACDNEIKLDSFKKHFPNTSPKAKETFSELEKLLE